MGRVNEIRVIISSITVSKLEVIARDLSTAIFIFPEINREW